MAITAPTILLVEDESHLRELTADLLTSQGFHPLQAENGQVAIEIFQSFSESIALVILDMHMPVLGGFAAWQIFHPLAPAVPILIASGYSRNDDVDYILRHSNGDFLPKPYRHKELLKRIRALLPPTQ